MSAGEEPQVSWKVVEAGADVISSEGEKAATVSRVVGDPDADVFTGLAVRVGILSGERLAPSERVTGIWADHVTVTPEMGLPKPSLTATTRGCGSWVPTGAD